PRLAMITASYARGVSPADCILRVVVKKSVEIEPPHQVLLRRQALVQPSVKDRLAVVAGVIQSTIRRQYKGRQRGGKERGSLLMCSLGRHKEKRVVLNDRLSKRARVLA